RRPMQSRQDVSHRRRLHRAEQGGTESCAVKSIFQRPSLAAKLPGLQSIVVQKYLYTNEVNNDDRTKPKRPGRTLQTTFTGKGSADRNHASPSSAQVSQESHA